MAESDGGESDPGAGRRTSGGDASPDPPRPQRPQLTKSRTISVSSPSSAASSAERWRGGGRESLLARRSTTAPLPPVGALAPRRLTVAVDDPSHVSPPNGGVLDRDWCYPSFLGPHVSRPRAPRQQQQQTPPPSDVRRNPSSNPAPPRRAPLSQREEEKRLASVVKLPPLLGERRPLSPPPPPLPPPVWRFDLSPYYFLLVSATEAKLASSM
jgi:hypothetical protein